MVHVSVVEAVEDLLDVLEEVVAVCGNREVVVEVVDDNHDVMVEVVYDRGHILFCLCQAARHEFQAMPINLPATIPKKFPVLQFFLRLEHLLTIRLT